MEHALASLRAAGLPAPQLAEIERQCGVMRTRIALRIARVGDLLAGLEPTPLPFDAAGFARPDGWREERDRGEPVHDRGQTGGRAALHIKAGGARCRASWRTSVFLKPGIYLFEGQVRTEGLPPAGYADLRISGDTRSLRLAGSSPWRPLQHQFLVEDAGGTDVELVCELNAAEGDAWFDLASLRLRLLREMEAPPGASQP